MATSNCVYQWVIKSFIQAIHSKTLIYLWVSHWIIHAFVHNHGFIQEWNEWLLMSHWITQANDALKTSLRNKTCDCLVSHWIIHTNKSLKHWFVQEINKWPSLRINHWNTHSSNSSKNTDSFRNCKWLPKSYTLGKYFFWTSNSNIYSSDLFKNSDSFRNKTSYWLYE